MRLKGANLIELFNAYARIGGAGISSNVRLVIDNRSVKEVTLDGKAINAEQIYRWSRSTIWQRGNDNMSAMRNAIRQHNTGVTLRDA